MKNWIKDTLLALILILISAGAYVLSKPYPDIASHFPTRIALVLGGLSVALLIKAVLFNRKTEEGNRKDTSHFKNVTLVIVAIGIYTSLLRYAGYLISSSCLVLFLIFFLGFTRKVPLVLTSLGIVLAVYAAFKLVLGVPLPAGPFFQG